MDNIIGRLYQLRLALILINLIFILYIFVVEWTVN